MDMGQFMSWRYLSHRWPAKARAKLRSLTRAFTARTYEEGKQIKAQANIEAYIHTTYLRMRVLRTTGRI